MDRSTSILVAMALVAAQALGCQKERTATLKAGGGRFNEVHYQIGEQDITLGRTALPWSKTLRIERGVSSVRLDVWSTQQQSWCEIWLDGQLCDREDEGRWCACYRNRKTDTWSGWPNSDQRRETLIR